MTDEEEEAQLVALMEEKTGEVLTALDGPVNPMQPAVFMPPGVAIALSDNRIAREHLADMLHAGWVPPTVEDNKLRITQQLDPIGMAIAIAQGMALPVFVPQSGGSVKVSYVQVPTKTRIQVMNKLLALVQANEKASVKDKEKGFSDPHAFLAMVKRAANLAEAQMANARLINGSAQVVEADPTEEERGMVGD